MFEGKTAVVTGGANGIGKCIAGEFRKRGAQVAVIDRAPGDHYVGDLADKSVLEDFAKYVIERYGHVDYLINNAPPLMRGIDECGYEEFQYACRWAWPRRFIWQSCLRPISAKAVRSSISPRPATA